MKLLSSVALGAAICALIGPFHARAAGETVLSLQLRNGALQSPLGDGDSVRFTRPQPGVGSVLVARSNGPVLCSVAGNPPAAASTAVVVDPTGYLLPYGVSARAGEPEIGLTSFPPNAMFRAGDRLAFDDLLYPVPPNYAFISDVAGNCVHGLSQPTVAQPVSCDTLPESFEADRIARGDFERGGQLELSSRVIDSTPSGVYYEHVIRAVGGPVSNVRLREQFPYRQNVPGQARFKDSMVIDSAWSCRASEGAQCNSASHSDAGMGYAHLDSASLDSGSCLRIVALRPTDSAGAIDNDFSGSVHAAVFYPGHTVQGAPVVATEQSRFDFD